MTITEKNSTSFETNDTTIKNKSLLSETEDDNTIKVVVALIISYAILMMFILCYTFICKSRFKIRYFGNDSQIDNAYYDQPLYEWLTDYFTNKLHLKETNGEDEKKIDVKKKSFFGTALSKVKLKGRRKQPDVDVLKPIDEEEEELAFGKKYV